MKVLAPIVFSPGFTRSRFAKSKTRDDVGVNPRARFDRCLFE